jgi:MOSC domain-containing protein YiiM
MTPHRLSTEQIEAKFGQLAESPNDSGVLECIVLRLPDEHRDTPQEAEVSSEGGLHGDRWGIVKTPNPRAQISVMNSRFLRVIAGSEHRMPLAGDNLLVDFNLSEDNLPTGTQLKIGTATFEVTDLPHTGCAKFERRYGSDALEFVNADAYAAQKLRGLFVRVIEPGQIRVGDTISKIRLS